MKLSEAIDLYIHRRRAVGAYLHGPETILRSFLHHYGNLDLHRIRTSQIAQFLNGRRGVRSSTWRGKYGTDCTETAAGLHSLYLLSNRTSAAS